MANVDRPNGFQPAKSLIGTDWNALIREYNADAAKSNPIGHGDPVTLAADGNVELAASGDTILGVAVGFGIGQTNHGRAGYFNADNLGKQFMAAADAGVVAVVPAEACLFEVQTDSDLDLVQGDLADFTATTTSTVTGSSTKEITTATNNDVRVVEQINSPDNDLTLANARHLVKFETTENTL